MVAHLVVLFDAGLQFSHLPTGGKTPHNCNLNFKSFITIHQVGSGMDNQFLSSYAKLHQVSNVSVASSHSQLKPIKLRACIPKTNLHKTLIFSNHSLETIMSTADRRTSWF